MKNISVSIAELGIAMVSIQSGAALAKSLFPQVGAIGATVLRLVLGATLLFCVWHPWKIRLTLKQAKAIALYGLVLGCMNIVFYMSLERIPLGIAVALEFLGPLGLAFLGSRGVLDWICAILAVLGVSLILPWSEASGSLDMGGVALGLAAGVFWALYIVCGQKAGNSLKGGQATAVGVLVAALVVLPFGAIFAREKLMNPSVLPLGFAMALLSSALPFTLEMEAMRNLPVRTFGILMSLEPVFAALSGFLFLGEYLSPIQCLAIVCIVMASLGSTLSAKQERKTEATAGNIPVEA